MKIKLLSICLAMGMFVFGAAVKAQDSAAPTSPAAPTSDQLSDLTTPADDSSAPAMPAAPAASAEDSTVPVPADSASGGTPETSQGN